MSLDEVVQLQSLLSALGSDKFSVEEDAYGTKIKCICPMHDDSKPSFMIRPESHIYHCFACESGPDIGYKCTAGLVSLVQKSILNSTGKLISKTDAYRMVVKHVDVPYAKRRKVRRSADLYAVKQIPEEHLSAYFPSQKAVWYMRKRGFSRKTVERFNVGYDMYKNRVIIPIRDGRDKLVAFIGRTTLHKDQLRLKDERRAAAGKDPFPRYMIYDNVPRRFLMLNQSFAEKGGDAVIVVESSMDYLMLRQWGYDNVVCILGSHASNWQWSLLSKFKRIYAFLDNDAAGASGVQGLIKNAEQTDIVIHVPNYEEADGDVDEMTHSRFKFLLETSTPVSRWVKKIPLLA